MSSIQLRKLGLKLLSTETEENIEHWSILSKMCDFWCIYQSVSNKRSAFPTNEIAFFNPKNTIFISLVGLAQIWRRDSGKIQDLESTPGLPESGFPTNADSDSILDWTDCFWNSILSKNVLKSGSRPSSFCLEPLFKTFLDKNWSDCFWNPILSKNALKSGSRPSSFVWNHFSRHF